MARSILLIRHAEKPDARVGILGIDVNGRVDPRSLSPRGWQRAGALAACLGTAERAVTVHPVLRVPAVLFAAEDPGRSQRPRQTLIPLSESLGVPIRPVTSQGDLRSVAAEIRACPGDVLVCWRHRELPILARALMPRQEGRVPDHWDEQRFDSIWAIDSTGLLVIAQRLLAGDWKSDPIR